MPVLFINLDARPDRKEWSLLELGRFHLAATRIPAVLSIEVDAETVALTRQTPGRVACWYSHRRAWQHLLAEDWELACIVEDDVRWIQDPRSFFAHLMRLEPTPDLVQLGALHQDDDGSPLRVRIADELALFSRIGTKLVPSLEGWETKFSERSQLMMQAHRRAQMRRWFIPWEVIPNQFGPGTHAYVISRRMAESLLTYNDPPFLAADDALSALAATGNFSAVRVRFPLATQAPLASDLK